MSQKDKLLAKLLKKPIPKDFTINELDSLMKKLDCEKYQGGRGSGIGYYDPKSTLCVQFDQPHPGKSLYRYQIEKVICFLKDIHAI